MLVRMAEAEGGVCDIVSLNGFPGEDCSVRKTDKNLRLFVFELACLDQTRIQTNGSLGERKRPQQ